MLSLISRSTGNTNKLDVRKGRPAAVGHPPGRAIRKSSRSSLVFHLWGLSSPFTVYEGQATKPVRAATRSACCFRGCSSARTDQRVQAGVCKAGRRRRGTCSRSAADGLTAISLHWRASNPSSARRHSDCHQYLPSA
jgi:hypothetical protein